MYNLVAIQEKTDLILRDFELKKKLLTENSKELESLKVKQRIAEKFVKELESKGTDPRVQEDCKRQLDLLNVLKLLLGVNSIEAPEKGCLKIEYEVQDKEVRQVCAKVLVVIHFAQSDGPIESYNVSDSRDWQHCDIAIILRCTSTASKHNRRRSHRPTCTS